MRLRARARAGEVEGDGKGAGESIAYLHALKYQLGHPHPRGNALAGNCHRPIKNVFKGDLFRTHAQR